MSRLTTDEIAAFCLSLPGAVVQPQAHGSRVFAVAGEPFAALDVAASGLAFRCSEAGYRKLLGEPGIVPAPSLLGSCWVSIGAHGRLEREDLLDHLRFAWGLAFQRLPADQRARLAVELQARGGRTH
jgi:predicted DNA-binding protein (MmcQ/YjbR family)